MNDSQHDAVLFFLAALFLGAVAAAVTTLATGCGGSQFTSLDTTRDAESLVLDAASASDDAGETGGNDVVIVIRTVDAESLDDVMNILEATAVQEAATEAAAPTCDLARCPESCMFGNTPCCTIDNKCGCTNFGPSCLGN